MKSKFSVVFTLSMVVFLGVFASSLAWADALPEYDYDYAETNQLPCGKGASAKSCKAKEVIKYRDRVKYVTKTKYVNKVKYISRPVLFSEWGVGYHGGDVQTRRKGVIEGLRTQGFKISYDLYTSAVWLAMHWGLQATYAKSFKGKFYDLSPINKDLKYNSLQSYSVGLSSHFIPYSFFKLMLKTGYNNTEVDVAEPDIYISKGKKGFWFGGGEATITIFTLGAFKFNLSLDYIRGSGLEEYSGGLGISF